MTEKKQGCGCGSKLGFQHPQPTQEQIERAASIASASASPEDAAPASPTPPTFLQVQERAAICLACPHNRGNSYCAKAKAPLMTLVSSSSPSACPCANFPNSEGVAKVYGLNFYGVPTPLRILIDKKAKKHNKTVQTGLFHGCGCLKLLKDASIKLDVEDSAEAIASALAPVVSILISFFIFAQVTIFRQLERLGIYKPSKIEIESRVDNNRYLVVKAPKGAVNQEALNKVVEDAKKYPGVGTIVKNWIQAQIDSHQIQTAKSPENPT
jgi:hypothetical protein